VRASFFSCLFAAALVCAQAPDTAPELRRAEQEASRVRALVKEGVLPRAALERAEEALAEARDLAILRATLYGQVAVEELTEPQTEAMLGAAQRNWSRSRKKFEHARKLVDEGAAARSTLEPFEEQLNRSREVHDLAVERGRLFRNLSEIVRIEEEIALLAEGRHREPSGPQPLVERYDGEGVFHEGHWKLTVLAFEKEFGAPLPVSARGETALHKALGFDHRGRVDVAVTPDSREGIWLRQYLESLHVPYYAIRGFVAGRATAAHLHIGPPSLRIRRTD
jgi:hypothetical protein